MATDSYHFIRFYTDPSLHIFFFPKVLWICGVFYFSPVLQIPVGSGKNFTGVVDLLTNQKLIWKIRSLGDDGRAFEIKDLEPSDDPELLQTVSEARTALIEQVVRS